MGNQACLDNTGCFKAFGRRLAEPAPGLIQSLA